MTDVEEVIHDEAGMNKKGAPAVEPIESEQEDRKKVVLE